ncbi:serine/threonine-protein kinase [Gemmatimonas groenlandica]|uniref:non-specific serine/threonine protein kinase n=1 Tax=Gemmatimonas groenlandica TaxID=2732249 RepID=A0A6M4IUT0_9BACT|nr:serine/threonine-protein kinase [Gemmatimonas groenlandica]QJR37918.1 protein kinase [Gemmatimonas groenlandica]
MTDTTALAAAIADRYTLDRELGRGGMATVYLARDIRHDRMVALKLLHPELGAVLGAERFLSEIRTTANLQHPNILPLFDSGSAAGLVFYVMPYVTGETLRDKLAREGQLSVNDAVRITRGIASALNYAHRQGVIHRDIKPENILLQDGQPLVADFGIALAVSNAGGTRITQTGLSVGTPAYMSPEQAAAERQLDGRSDQYSLASVLYELLAGGPPFTGASAAAVMSRVMTEVPRPVHALRPAVPESVSDALSRALEKVPADRYESVAHFADALAVDGSSGYRASKAVAAAGPWKRRALVIAAIGVVAAGASWMVPRSSSATLSDHGSAPRFFSIALPDSLPLVPGRDRFGAALRSLDISGDGRRLVYTAGRGDSTELAIADLDDGTVALVSNTPRASMPTFAPDDRAIAFMQDTLLRRINANGDGGTTLAVFRTLESLAWGRDGRVYGAGYASCLQSVPETGGAVRIDSAPGCPVVITPTHQPLAQATPLVVDSRLHLIPATGGAAIPIRALAAAPGDSDVVQGSHPLLVDNRFLVFVRDSTMFAAPIDISSARLTGAPRVLLSGVHTEHFPVQAHMALSGEGTLVWVSGRDASRAQFVRVRRNGTTIDTLPIPEGAVKSFALSPDGMKVAWSTPARWRKELMVYDIGRRVTETYVSDRPIMPVLWLHRGGDSLITSYSGNTSAVRLAGRRVDQISAPPMFHESIDGKWRCRGGLVWPAARLQDSVRLILSPTQCRFSYDVRSIVMKADDGLFVAPVAKLVPETVVRISAFGDEPHWTGDSRSVLFRDGDRWYEVPMSASGSPLSPPKLLFTRFFNQANATSWGLDEQGRMMMLQGPPLVRTTRINVITNFPRFVAEKLK